MDREQDSVGRSVEAVVSIVISALFTCTCRLLFRPGRIDFRFQAQDLIVQ
jgi:hypothetical protein